MKKALMTFFFLATLSIKALAEPAGPAGQTHLDIDVANLSSKIGNTMFAYYQMNYHDQIAVITTLKYCEAEDAARKVADTLPDLRSFYLTGNPQQLLYDIVNKEAMISGYDVKSEEEFERISNQSLLKGQSYFAGYLKGYQIAMQTFSDKKVRERLCKATIDEAEKYIKKESLVSQSR